MLLDLPQGVCCVRAQRGRGGGRGSEECLASYSTLADSIAISITLFPTPWYPFHICSKPKSWNEIKIETLPKLPRKKTLEVVLLVIISFITYISLKAIIKNIIYCNSCLSLLGHICIYFYIKYQEHKFLTNESYYCTILSANHVLAKKSQTLVCDLSKVTTLLKKQPRFHCNKRRTLLVDLCLSLWYKNGILHSCCLTLEFNSHDCNHAELHHPSTKQV